MSKPHITHCDFRQYKDLTNQLVMEESVFIALINRHADVLIKRRSVKSSVTLPFLCIAQITFSMNDSILFSQLIEDKIGCIKSLEMSQGVKESTANERLKKNRLKQTNFLLNDILSEIGYFNRTKFEKRKTGGLVLEFIDSIECVNGDFFDGDDIAFYGKRINNFLEKAINEKPSVLFEKDNQQLQNLIGK
ncbi:hypothetical protein EIN_340700 [Entamoeba invadens IP1]|uniref:Uncharacterized protein n=1 Tax=Entamoeba invadens IP1 TaxID=370355 RepID=A0A0A1UE17_ENTIV|nr:hypothetical protein EIN_340700 [Entamoeba invadens IP1]ELP94732.1 hypothetical protein EIN_340700 [Entamoeba invadens IP1]|eukprot:XP_004261503.1 hypothetical protein EIN_340700 [Entamoeba invadens IP1]